MGEFVTLETKGGIGTIRLNRPKVNALNDQVTAELAAAAREAAASDEVRAVIVYGGEKVFCGGADIEVLAEAGYAEMAVRSAKLIFLAVGTPSGEDGAANLSSLWLVINAIAPHLPRDAIVELSDGRMEVLSCR